MKAKIKKKLFKKKNEPFDNNDQETTEINNLKKNFLKSLEKPKDSSILKNNNLDIKNCIKKLYFFASLKIKKKYDCTPTKYDSYMLDYLLNNIDCHIVSQFKEKMLSDYIEEFLRRQYTISESNIRIPKFSIYYKNYLQFFCKPTYNCFKFNKIIQNYGEKKAELYYKANYNGGVTNEEKEDNGMEESSSDESSNKENEYQFNDDGKIFNNMVKEKIDNVTVMTTINSTGNNTINLNINNEKIEVFSENKAEISNDTTIGEIMDDIKNEMQKIKIKKKKSIKKKFKYSYKSIMNFSLKSQDGYKDNKYHKNLSIENRKKANSKDYSKKLLLNKDIKENINKNKIKFSNDKIINQKIKSQLFKYNIESYKINKNHIHKISHEKIQKILKNRYSKNVLTHLYNSNYPYSNFSKDSRTNIRNISSNIKSTENRCSKKTSISGFSEKKIKYKSRNGLRSFYNNIIGGNTTTTGKNSNMNFQTTYINKGSLTNLVKSGNKAFKTMNLMKTATHQRTNSQLVQNQKLVKNKKKLYDNPNYNKIFIPEKKTSSLKLLVTEIGNQSQNKPPIKIKKNEKLKNRNINNNNSKRKINSLNKNNQINNMNNHKITVTINDYFNKLNNRNPKTNNLNLKKTFGGFNESLKINHSNMINDINQQKSLYNNEDSETFRKNMNYNNSQNKINSNLMQIALSLLIDNNSAKKQTENLKYNMNMDNINNNTSLNNNDQLMKTNIINQTENKNNNYFNINSPTHYNININNQINININNKINDKFNNIRLSQKKQNKSRKNINNNHSTKLKKTIPKKKININTELIQKKFINLNGITNNKIKIRTRNYNDSLKNGFTQNPNYINDYHSSRNEKIIKGYHTKSVSNLAEMINHNKKLIALYKSMSKSKEKK